MSNETSATTWIVYIVESDDQSLYTGITNDLSKRLQAHRQGKGGAKYFRGRVPTILRWIEDGHSRSSASKREYQIKSLSRVQKLELIEENPRNQCLETL